MATIKGQKQGPSQTYKNGFADANDGGLLACHAFRCHIPKDGSFASCSTTACGELTRAGDELTCVWPRWRARNAGGK